MLCFELCFATIGKNGSVAQRKRTAATAGSLCSACKSLMVVKFVLHSMAKRKRSAVGSHFELSLLIATALSLPARHANCVLLVRATAAAPARIDPVPATVRKDGRYCRDSDSGAMASGETAFARMPAEAIAEVGLPRSWRPPEIPSGRPCAFVEGKAQPLSHNPAASADATTRQPLPRHCRAATGRAPLSAAGSVATGAQATLLAVMAIAGAVRVHK
mmetsp:Transcript_25674/g.58154  ORF Transcript_25674/g.58154 Transcript_25674/m.58154 type:complete len:217 (-) Transcript_25674:12-662(-)